uniref:Hexosyltransferase n=1 Tax=Panagrellus redivivus TaxID=6233 RepID=A0A7E4ZWK9_PANRE
MKVILRQKTALIVCAVLFEVFVFYLGRWSVSDSDGVAVSPESGNLVPSAPKPVPTLQTYLLILIMSSPGDAQLRETIRNTWLKLSNKGPTVSWAVFPIGTANMDELTIAQLNAENKKFGDLVFLPNVTESYDKLARKTADGIRYAVENYDFKFLLKVDSDSFVRVGALLKALRDIAHPRLYWGFLDGRAKPFRSGKWKEVDWLLCDRYLPYQLGGGYVISRDLAVFVASNARFLKYYVSEDVSLGVWLAPTNAKYVHDPRFDTEFQSRGCNNEYLITHKKAPAQMVTLFANLKQTGRLCFKEFQARPSYVYDFSVPPSQCCTRRNNSAIP